MKQSKSWTLLVTLCLIGMILGCSKPTDPKGASKPEPAGPLTAERLDQPVVFANAQLPSYVHHTYGLDGAEAFGRWTTEKVVLIEFNGTLPEKFDVELVAGAFGPNVGANARAVAGSMVREFKVTTELNQAKPYVLEFSGINGGRGIAFEIQAPTSPAEMGKGNDPRKLGLAMVSLKITPKP